MAAPKDPPLVSLQVTNPVTYLRIWWKKIVGNDGIDFSFRIRPLTAVFMTATITLILTGAGYSLGKIAVPIPEPLDKYIPKIIPSPTPIVWRETAFSGSLKFTESTKRYYLVTTSSEAITLQVPENIDLSKFVGKRIMASGNYNKGTRILVVSDAQDLEVLPTKAVTIPTLIPTPTNVPAITP